jgi:predicted flap endonuclease-1-like 5' DNA nuclease
MTALATIEGIGGVYDGKLKGVGVTSVEKLLEMGASPKGRKDLAEKAGISGDLILKWVNRADLYRVKGIAEEYSDLLEAAGVDTVVELAQRKAANLYAKLVEVNEAKKLVRQMPTQASVSAWIDSAKTLPRVVTY